MADQVFPEPTVGILIVNTENKFLLIRSHKWNNLFVIPGGHVELGESLEQTAIRESKEETGLDIYDLRFGTHYEFVQEASFYKKRHFIFFDFIAHTKVSTVSLNNEGQEYIWISIQEIDNYQIEKYSRKFIEYCSDKGWIL